MGSQQVGDLARAVLTAEHYYLPDRENDPKYGSTEAGSPTSSSPWSSISPQDAALPTDTTRPRSTPSTWSPAPARTLVRHPRPGRTIRPTGRLTVTHRPSPGAERATPVARGPVTRRDTGLSIRSSTWAAMSRSSRSQWTKVRETVSTVSPRCPATAVRGAPSARSVEAHQCRQAWNTNRSLAGLGERWSPPARIELVASQHRSPAQTAKQHAVGCVVPHVPAQLHRNEARHRDRPDLLGLGRRQPALVPDALHLSVDGHPPLPPGRGGRRSCPGPHPPAARPARARWPPGTCSERRPGSPALRPVSAHLRARPGRSDRRPGPWVPAGRRSGPGRCARMRRPPA